MQSPNFAPHMSGTALSTMEHSRMAINPRAEMMAEFDGAGSEVNHPRGTTLFMEDQAPTQVIIVNSGRVKLTIASREGRSIIVRVAGPGTVLGLSAALQSRAHEVTAEVIENASVREIPVREFMALLQKRPGAAMAATRLVLEEHDAVFSDIRRFALPATIAGRLASLLLGWLEERGQAGGKENRIIVSLTHEEIASMTGTSRETVSRVLQQFRREKLIAIKGVCLTVLRPEALEQLAV
jgi:CRP/FNR family transcriptional regulator, cyclic AMP receptor protein